MNYTYKSSINERILTVIDWILVTIANWGIEKVLDYLVSKLPPQKPKDWVDFLGFNLAVVSFILFLLTYVVKLIEVSCLSVSNLLLCMVIGWGCVLGVFFVNQVLKISSGDSSVLFATQGLLRLITLPSFLVFIAFALKFPFELLAGFSTEEVESINIGYKNLMLISWGLCIGSVVLLAVITVSARLVEAVINKIGSYE